MMNISHRVLSRYIQIDDDPKILRKVLDDIGIEVKRTTPVDGDTIYGLELLANRGDHYCYQGVAREIRGRTGLKSCGPIVTPLEIGATELDLTVETDKCLVYSATMLERVGASLDFPKEVLAPLEAAGIHSLTAPIDATNLSNIELGQPTHAFDADTIVGGIVIREAHEGEKAWPLFSEGKVTLPKGAIVIADSEKVLAIAGVIGCEESKTTESSTRILLESACFEPVSVRKTARALNIHTDSVARFERGSDPTYPLIGAGRVVYLLEEFGGFRRVGASSVVGDFDYEAKQITLSPSRVNLFLSLSLSTDEIQERLERYGFTTELEEEGDISVSVPPHRMWDVKYEDCLFEVLAISVGYNNTPIALPPVDIGALRSLREEIQESVEEIFLSQGFYEVFTNGFYGRPDRERLGITESSPLFAHVEIQNSLDRGYSLLKNNALVHAIEAFSKNKNTGQKQILMYEWTRTFLPNSEAPNGVCDERKLLWALASGTYPNPNWSDQGRLIDPLMLKGLVQELSVLLRLPFRLDKLSLDEPLNELLHPNRSASIWLFDKRVGVMGELHPAVRLSQKAKKLRPVYLEIEESALCHIPEQHRYQVPSIYQPLKRTLAFALPPKIEAQNISELLGAFGAQVSVVDEFCYTEEGINMRALTFELITANPAGDITADLVNQQLQELIQSVHQQLGSLGVHQR
jgi:phenylalanyl-tRNA synthetase beta chain